LPVLSSLGAVLCLWLFYSEVLTHGIAICPTGGGCQTAAESRYAWVGNVHVSLIGLAGYLVITLLSLSTRAGMTPWRRRLLAGTATGGILFTLYLQYAALLILHTTCFWCLLSAGVMVSIWGLAVRNI
jgi:uncharacterized membrane protein